MRIHVIAVGAMKNTAERVLVDEFSERARKTGKQIGIRDVREYEMTSGGGKSQEANRLLSQVPERAFVACLHEKGQCLESPEFARLIQRERDNGRGDFCFAIGGAAGHGAEILDRADKKIAFGVQTWPHRLVRVMLAEQVYRAMTILAGLPYHKA